jgi:hypothetical protein
MFTDILRHTPNIHIIQRGIHLIEHEERTGLVTMNREQQRQRRNRFLATTQMLHIPEALQRGHSVVFQAGKIGLGAVFHVEVGLAAERELAALGQIFVGAADVFGDVVEGFLEEVETLLLDVFKVLFGF